MTPTKTKEEPKQSLGLGDPEASYVTPDLSFQDGAGTLPENEQAWHDERDDARAEQAEAAADAEDAVVKRRAAEAEAASSEAPAKTSTKASTSSSSSSSS